MLLNLDASIKTQPLRLSPNICRDLIGADHISNSGSLFRHRHLVVNKSSSLGVHIRAGYIRRHGTPAATGKGIPRASGRIDRQRKIDVVRHQQFVTRFCEVRLSTAHGNAGALQKQPIIVPSVGYRYGHSPGNLWSAIPLAVSHRSRAASLGDESRSVYSLQLHDNDRANAVVRDRRILTNHVTN